LQPETTVVPLEEEEVPVPQAPFVTVPPEEEVPLKEDEFPAPAIAVPQDPYCGPAEGRGPPSSALVAVPPEGRGYLVPVTALVCSFPFFFSLSKTHEVLLTLFSYKCGRFVGLEPDLC
jgi:hypothetical protein